MFSRFRVFTGKCAAMSFQGVCNIQNSPPSTPSGADIGQDLTIFPSSKIQIEVVLIRLTYAASKKMQLKSR